MEFRGTPAARAVVFYSRDYGGFRVRLAEKARDNHHWADVKRCVIIGKFILLAENSRRRYRRRRSHRDVRSTAETSDVKPRQF